MLQVLPNYMIPNHMLVLSPVLELRISMFEMRQSSVVRLALPAPSLHAVSEVEGSEAPRSSAQESRI